MISNLKAVVTGEVNEAFYLIKNGKYIGFNHLHDLVGHGYTNLNDDLMNGNYDIYRKYRAGKCVLNIEFIAE